MVPLDLTGLDRYDVGSRLFAWLLAGGALGMSGVAFAGVEAGIALSALLLGALVLLVARPNLGFAALLMLVPLAATSTNAMMRRLKRRWQSLHRLIYPIAILGVWHYWWQVKKDLTEPLIYAAILATLLGWRLWKRRSATSSSKGQSVSARRASRAASRRSSMLP